MLYSSDAATRGGIANVVAFLANPAAHAITGPSCIVDGGLRQSILNYGPGVAVTPQGT